jgi:hypothetical protein
MFDGQAPLAQNPMLAVRAFVIVALPFNFAS